MLLSKLAGNTDAVVKFELAGNSDAAGCRGGGAGKLPELLLLTSGCCDLLLSLIDP
jgi:hypothetical protein